ncbi:hypothetical protein [Haliangium sp.]|uniref:hypothetical protein n=1 Tax=Haliangium sp. TaxID=2663208 RepID=UPI003D0A9C6B
MIAIASPNDVQVYAGTSKSVGLNGQGTTVLTSLPAYRNGRSLTRIMIKVFQRPGDAQFGFSANVNDADGNKLDDVLVIKLGPEGSI